MFLPILVDPGWNRSGIHHFHFSGIGWKEGFYSNITVTMNFSGDFAMTIVLEITKSLHETEKLKSMIHPVKAKPN